MKKLLAALAVALFFTVPMTFAQTSSSELGSLMGEDLVLMDQVLQTSYKLSEYHVIRISPGEDFNYTRTFYSNDYRIVINGVDRISDLDGKVTCNGSTVVTDASYSADAALEFDSTREQTCKITATMIDNGEGDDEHFASLAIYYD
jgi:hypothetical protein